MSWVEIDDAVAGRMVVELQPTVLEVFQARVAETRRYHLRLLTIEHQGADGQGNHRVVLGSGGGGSDLLLTVPEPSWIRLWPLLEQARAAQYPYLGY